MWNVQEPLQGDYYGSLQRGEPVRLLRRTRQFSSAWLSSELMYGTGVRRSVTGNVRKRRAK